jgi:hypothetical protein
MGGIDSENCWGLGRDILSRFFIALMGRDAYLSRGEASPP